MTNARAVNLGLPSHPSARLGGGSRRGSGCSRCVHVPGPALALHRAVPGRTGARGRGCAGRSQALLFRRGERRGLAHRRRRPHLAPHLRRRAGGFHRRPGRRALGAAGDLCRHGRGRHALRHRPGRRRVQVHRRRRDLGLHRAEGYPPDRQDPGGPPQSGRAAGGGARPPLRPERGARRVPLHRRRPHLDPDPVQGRRHRGHRHGLPARKPGRGLRLALADAAAALERLSAVERSGRRRLQVHRRGADLDGAGRPRPAGQARPHRLGHHARAAEPRLRPGRCGGGRRALPLRRCGGELGQAQRGQAHLAARLVLRRDHRRPRERRPCLGLRHHHPAFRRRRGPLPARQGRPYGRRLPQPVDRSRGPRAPHPGRRPGDAGDAEWGRHLEFLVQPADGPVLPRGHRRPLPLPRLRRPAGLRRRRRSQPHRQPGRRRQHDRASTS